nr:hypothetical protein Iba_chr07aCG6190 [Ipomoea batatas]
MAAKDAGNREFTPPNGGQSRRKRGTCPSVSSVGCYRVARENEGRRGVAVARPPLPANPYRRTKGREVGAVALVPEEVVVDAAPPSNAVARCHVDKRGGIGVQHSHRRERETRQLPCMSSTSRRSDCATATFAAVFCLSGEKTREGREKVAAHLHGTSATAACFRKVKGREGSTFAVVACSPETEEEGCVHVLRYVTGEIKKGRSLPLRSTDAELEKERGGRNSSTRNRFAPPPSTAKSTAATRTVTSVALFVGNDGDSRDVAAAVELHPCCCYVMKIGGKRALLAHGRSLRCYCSNLPPLMGWEPAAAAALFRQSRCSSPEWMNSIE